MGAREGLAGRPPDIIDDSGHTGSPAMGEAVARAVARFARPDTDRVGRAAAREAGDSPR
ncbi:hypothetical protein ACIBEH_01580 [Nocardia salmonicida]|uniref:hypothetical protein n=1 Tax=Nocardia salmonicida TaxID=53431 RepID=UPI00340D4A67